MKKKVLESVCLVLLCMIPLFLVMGCGPGNCVKCTVCGDDSNRLFVYASGTTDDGVEYQSCVGLSGLMGCGFGTKCLPTECMSVHKAKDSNNAINGCVCYYSDFGCIQENEKSDGIYTDTYSCLGVSCTGSKYNEAVYDDTVKAVEQNYCLGMGCGEKVQVESKDYNEQWKRQFPKGCWSCSPEE